MKRWTLLLAVASASCHPDPFEGDVSRSQFFEYHDQVQEPLCPTLLSKLDLHAQTIGAKVGLTVDPSNPYKYFKFRDEAAFAPDSGGCPSENGACALGNEVYSTTYFHAHEQSHDYAFRAWGGFSNGLLDEGQAVAMSCLPFYQLHPFQKPTDVVGMLDWRDLLHLFGNSDDGYAAAGFFVTYLANQYGWDSVGQLYRKVSWGSSADDVAQAFAEVFPTTMDQAWSAALGAPDAAPCQRDWQCMTTAMAVGDVATPDCDGEMHRSIDVGAQGGGVVLATTGTGFYTMLLSCSDPRPAPYILAPGPAGYPTTHWAGLPEGSYAMFPGPFPASVTLQAEISGPLVSETCASAVTVSLDPPQNVYVDFPTGVIDGWMHLAGGGHSYDVSPYNLTWPGQLTTGAVSICTDCSGTSCVPILVGKITPVTIGDQSVVRFQGVSSTPSTLQSWGQLTFSPTSGQ